MVQLSTLLLAAAATLTSAIDFAAPLAPNLSERSAVVGGGWSLQLTTCPTDSTTTCNYNGCCPKSLECFANGNVLSTFCCTPGTNCLSAIRASPFCADDSWSLWNSTVNDRGSATAGFFCCLPGQKGLQDKSCVAAGTVVVPTLSAQLLSSGTGAAGAPSTSSSVVAATTSSAATTTTATTAATTSRAATTTQASTSDGSLFGAGSFALGLAAVQLAFAALI